MLKIYTAIAAVIAVAIGVEDSFRGSTSAGYYTADCSSRAVICAGGTVYHWASALSVAAVALLILLWFGWPIIIAGRIGKVRNRHGYLAGIFFGWLGLAWVVLLPLVRRNQIGYSVPCRTTALDQGRTADPAR